MSPKPFTQAAVTRAVRAMNKAGLMIAGVKLSPDGSIHILTDLGQTANDGSPNPLDRVLKR